MYCVYWVRCKMCVTCDHVISQRIKIWVNCRKDLTNAFESSKLIDNSKAWRLITESAGQMASSYDRHQLLLPKYIFTMVFLSGRQRAAGQRSRDGRALVVVVVL